MMFSLVRERQGWFSGCVFCMKKKEPRMKRESLPLANRIFLASGLKNAYRIFLNALTGKMLASGFDYQMRSNFSEGGSAGCR